MGDCSVHQHHTILFTFKVSGESSTTTTIAYNRMRKCECERGAAAAAFLHTDTDTPNNDKNAHKHTHTSRVYTARAQHTQQERRLVYSHAPIQLTSIRAMDISFSSHSRVVCDTTVI